MTSSGQIEAGKCNIWKNHLENLTERNKHCTSYSFRPQWHMLQRCEVSIFRDTWLFYLMTSFIAFRGIDSVADYLCNDQLSVRGVIMKHNYWEWEKRKYHHNETGLLFSLHLLTFVVNLHGQFGNILHVHMLIQYST